MKRNSTIIQVLGSISAGIGLLSVLGYITEWKWMYNWYGETKMALNTAIQDVIQGVVIIWIGSTFKNGYGKDKH